MPNNKTIREKLEELDFVEWYATHPNRCFHNERFSKEEKDKLREENLEHIQAHKDAVLSFIEKALLTQLGEIEDMVENTRVHIEREVVDPLVDFSKSFSEEDAVDSLRGAMNNLLTALKEKKDNLN